MTFTINDHGFEMRSKLADVTGLLGWSAGGERGRAARHTTS
jgi:hypothetical protein